MLYKLEDNIMIENFSNAFDKIGKQWMLITASDGEKVNAMTASWGGLGTMWGKDVAYVVIRESRFTKEFIDREGKFSLSFPPEKYRKHMKFLGTVSGSRNTDSASRQSCCLSLSGLRELYGVLSCLQ